MSDPSTDGDDDAPEPAEPDEPPAHIVNLADLATDVLVIAGMTQQSEARSRTGVLRTFLCAGGDFHLCVDVVMLARTVSEADIYGLRGSLAAKQPPPRGVALVVNGVGPLAYAAAAASALPAVRLLPCSALLCRAEVPIRTCPQEALRMLREMPWPAKDEQVALEDLPVVPYSDAGSLLALAQPGDVLFFGGGPHWYLRRVLAPAR